MIKFILPFLIGAILAFIVTSWAQNLYSIGATDAWVEAIHDLQEVCPPW